MYLPDHEKIPGYLNITCKFEEEVGWKKEEWFTFQYLRGKLFFLVYPTLVQFSLGEATSVEGAIEKEKNAIEAIWTGVSDADVEKLVSLGPIDPAHLTKEQKDLIDAIAKNCTQYPDGKQVMLGNWAGLGDGYVAAASETGSVSYVAHPDLWPMLGKNGAEQQEQIAWLINQQVMQPRIEQGLPFEYTLDSIMEPEKLVTENDAIKAIWRGKSTDEVLSLIKETYPDKTALPSRMKEMQELYNAGYIYTFDTAHNSYILIKP